jgi:two-component system phosphate regulon response regulator PhoB
MISSSAEEADVIAGLDSGADDYITKPFGICVLLARIRAALRGRGNHLPREKTLIEIGDVVIDPARHRVIHKGKAVTLTVHQFGIFYYLATRPGVVCSREEIITAVKGDDYPVTERSVDVQIVALRKKLRHAGDLIETVRGVGYRISSSHGLQDP